MPVVRGCNLPDDLLYDVPNNLWYRPEADGTYTVGMTMIATGMAGALVAFTAKKVGKSIEGGKSVATIESGKWVGPAKIGFDVEIVGVNDILTVTPKLANTDTYTITWTGLNRGDAIVVKAVHTYDFLFFATLSLDVNSCAVMRLEQKDNGTMTPNGAAAC